MSIKTLKVDHIRNLTSIKINPSPSINLFFGKNGSGKTSLLESIYFLGLARSFRSHRLTSFIEREYQTCSVFGEIQHDTHLLNIGVSRGLEKKQQIKIEGIIQQSVSELAQYVPIQLINPDSFTCLQASPSVRRKILDWGAFYENPSFGMLWKKMQLSLKQRNALLRKTTMNSIELEAWTNSFLETSLQIDQFRTHYMEKLIPEFKHTIDSYTTLKSIELSYYPGWNKLKDLKEILTHNQSRDILLGYTTSGPQKADLRVTQHGIPATDVLSRGQQKILVCALKIAQGRLFEKTKNQPCVFLIDDLPAELDIDHCQQFIQMISSLTSQFWLTAINTESLLPLLTRNTIKMFHVEQGHIHLN